MRTAEPLSVARNATWLTLATLAARACTFALAVVMGRKLGVTDYGRYGFATAIATIVVPLADLGMTPYVGREVARDRGAGEAQAARLLALKARLAFGALALATAISALSAGERKTAEAIVIVLTAMLADGLSSFVFGYYQGRERMVFEAHATALTALARSVGGIVLALVSGQLVPVLVWMLLTSGVQLAIALRRFNAALGESTQRTAGAVAWRSVAALGAASLSWLVYLQSDSVILGIVYDKHAVGLYTAAYAVTFGLQILPWQLAVAFSPVFARAHSTDRRLYDDTWHQALRTVLMVALPLSLVTSLLARPLITLMFGARFHAAGSALAILVWSSPLWAANTIVSAAVRGAGRDNWLAITAGVGLGVNLVMNAWAIPLFGIDGAAAVTVGTEFTVLTAQSLLALSRKVVPRPRLPWLRLAVALAGAAVVALATRSAGIVVALAASLTVYIAAVTAMGVIPVAWLRRPWTVTEKRQ